MEYSALKRSQQTDKLRKQGMDVRELFSQFLELHPDIDLTEDNDLTLRQQQEWDAYSAPLLAYHQVERQQLNESGY